MLFLPPPPSPLCLDNQAERDSPKETEITTASFEWPVWILLQRLGNNEVSLVKKTPRGKSFFTPRIVKLFYDPTKNDFLVTLQSITKAQCLIYPPYHATRFELTGEEEKKSRVHPEKVRRRGAITNPPTTFSLGPCYTQTRGVFFFFPPREAFQCHARLKSSTMCEARPRVPLIVFFFAAHDAL